MARTESYDKECRDCGEEVTMVQAESGQWLCLEYDADHVIEDVTRYTRDGRQHPTGDFVRHEC